MPIRVHIADDHAIFRSGLRAYLEKTGDITVAGETGDGFKTLAWFEDNEADVLLLDVAMPGLGGAAVARELAGAAGSPRILVLTMHDDEHYLKEFLGLGCRGFILKSSPAVRLVEGIRTVGEGGVYVDPALSRHMVAPFAPALRRPAARDELTPRERDVCRVLALGNTNEEAAAILCISRRTVETHRAAIMSKLDLKTRADLVRYALDAGLINP
jgi:DNA-binding NarL/FixJ family response regulator